MRKTVKLEIHRARRLRNSITDAEQALWQRLRNRRLNGLKFRRQQPIGPYIVDFVCFERHLVIEIDGGQHSDQIEYDRQRSRWLIQQGFRVLRYWNHEVLCWTNSVLEEILQVAAD